MKNPAKKILQNQSSILLLALTLVVLVMVVSILIMKRKDTHKAQETRPVPVTKSKVPDLEIVSARREGEAGTDNEMLIVRVQNNSDKGVISYRVRSGDFGESFSTGTDSRITEDMTMLAIEPHGFEDLEIPMANLVANKPLVLTAAIFDDGSEHGTQQEKAQIHEQRKKFKEQRQKGDRIQ